MNDDPEIVFRRCILANPVICSLMERLPRLALPDCWLAASALMQTVWNVLEGRPPAEDIRDYDVFYFDDSDLSFDAEDRVIKASAEAFRDINALIEVRNQARVHLWFNERNGTTGYGPLRSACEGIDRFLATPAMFGIQPRGAGAFTIYAPRGYDGLFNWGFRPNSRAIGPAWQFQQQALRRKKQYPRLTILPWESRFSVEQLSSACP